MLISSATIDCWLYVGGRTSLTGAPGTDVYFDFQHHHWVLKPSGPIDSMNNNTPPYTWTVDRNGHDPNGSWSTPPGGVSPPPIAKFRIPGSARLP